LICVLLALYFIIKTALTFLVISYRVDTENFAYWRLADMTLEFWALLLIYALYSNGVKRLIEKFNNKSCWERCRGVCGAQRPESPMADEDALHGASQKHTKKKKKKVTLKHSTMPSESRTSNNIPSMMTRSFAQHRRRETATNTEAEAKSSKRAKNVRFRVKSKPHAVSDVSEMEMSAQTTMETESSRGGAMPGIPRMTNDYSITATPWQNRQRRVSLSASSVNGLALVNNASTDSAVDQCAPMRTDRLTPFFVDANSAGKGPPMRFGKGTMVSPVIEADESDSENERDPSIGMDEMPALRKITDLDMNDPEIQIDYGSE